jgi:hypothetical protein
MLSFQYRSALLWSVCLFQPLLRGQAPVNDAISQPIEKTQETPVAGPAATAIDKRAFGVLPNYRTADGSLPFEPISAKYKLTIAVKDSFDGPLYGIGGIFAAIYQAQNQNPSFGQGMAGYARRYFTSFADQAIGNMMTEGFMPSLLHQDPRYFRRGTGSKKSRLAYALTRIFICKNDSGKWGFNYSEVLGNSVGAAISNAYYPDTRTVHENVEKLGIQLGTDALSQVAKEFWPDIKRKWFSKHKDQLDR